MRTRLALSGLLCSALFVAACVGGDDLASQEDNIFESKPIGPEPAGSPTRYPIILHHGFAASATANGFTGVDEPLRADGHEVYVAEAPPFQPADVRARYLGDYVDQALANGAEKVNIIAHSMGGLDARALVSTLGYGDRVASITTISSPHRGTAIADVILETFGSDTGQTDTLEALARAFGVHISEVAESSDMRAALTDMTEAGADVFNAAHADDDRVHYMSVAGVSNVAGIKNPNDLEACAHAGFTKSDGSKAYPLGGRADVMDALLKPIAKHVAHGFAFTPNDGVVSVESAMWGEFLGCVPADHMDEVGQFDDHGTNRRTGFNHVRFYRNHAFLLARAGH